MELERLESSVERAEVGDLIIPAGSTHWCLVARSNSSASSDRITLVALRGGMTGRPFVYGTYDSVAVINFTKRIPAAKVKMVEVE